MGADREAAREADGMLNRWYLDPLFRGTYPEDAVADRVRRGHLDRAQLPFVQPGDLAEIATPFDFLGVNYYSRGIVRAGEDGAPVGVQVVPAEQLTDMGWEVHPQGLHDLLVRLDREYAPARIYITESGAAYADGPDATGRVHDARRVEFLRGHLQAAMRALGDGVPLCGFFTWSLLDNFEWAHGYTKRFGLYWVDFVTQQRIPKDSALWYRDVVAASTIDGTTLEPGARRSS
jgi:beta-glucosidase